MTRADSEIIKAMIIHGAPLEWVRAWQQLPFFEIDKNVFERYAGDADVFDTPVGHPNKPLPYDDFIISPTGLEVYRYADNVKPTCQVFIRVSVAQKANGMHYMPKYDPVPPDDGTIIYAYALVIALDYEDGLKRPLHFMYGEKQGKLLVLTEQKLSPNLNLHHLVTAMSTLVNNVVSYLMCTPKHVVEQRNPSPRCSTKTAKLKPWLRDDLPSLVFMANDDPRFVRRSSSTSNGAHKRPHSRRAHWRRWKERRVFVRACWIGPDEWSCEGRQYRVRQNSTTTLP